MLENNLAKRPSWLRVKAPSTASAQKLRSLLAKNRVHTVCASAACPNMGECWSAGTATFMILGNQCTRACRFCNIQSTKKPNPVDLLEPQRVVESAKSMGLKHIVITSVARDDLPDGGAEQFARVLNLLKKEMPQASCEVLIPDLLGNIKNLEKIISQQPEILNHNLETTARLTPKIRSGGKYTRSLELLENAKKLNTRLITKSGLMLGLGEEDHEIIQALKDLRAHNCDHITLGQYLRPTPWHHPIMRYVTPEKFLDFKNIALKLGFSHVESGPLVRSSYHAERGIINKTNL